MIAAGNEHEVLIAGADGDIEVSRFRIDALEGEALLRVEPVVVELLQGTLDAGLVLIVLVRRIGRPVPRRREDFYKKQPGRRIFLREDPVDTPFGDALAPDLDTHIVGSDQSGRERGFRGRRDDGEP